MTLARQDSDRQEAREALLTMLAGVVHDVCDPSLMEQPVVDDAYDDLEHARPIDVAMAATTLLLPLLRRLADLEGLQAEDVLQRTALEAAANPIPPLDLD